MSGYTWRELERADIDTAAAHAFDMEYRAERTCETCAYKHLSKYSGKAVWVEEDEVLCMRQPIGECEYYVVRKVVEQ